MCQQYVTPLTPYTLVRDSRGLPGGAVSKRPHSSSCTWQRTQELGEWSRTLAGRESRSELVVGGVLGEGISIGTPWVQE